MQARGRSYRAVARGRSYRAVARGRSYRAVARGRSYRAVARGRSYRAVARGRSYPETVLAGYDHLLTAARRLQWDAEAIALARDRAALVALDTPTRARLRTLVAGFVVAEHAVAAELEPFVAAAAELDPDPGAQECFARQARDERRHARWFDRLAGEMFGLDRPAAQAAAPAAIRELFESELPATARALAVRTDPAQLAAAVGLYHVVLEGIAFAVGQEALLDLARGAGLQGVAEGVGRVQADERWHVGLGVLALQRLGAPVWIEAAARRAAAAWGPAVATPERTARVLAAHGRRLTIVAQREQRAAGR